MPLKIVHTADIHFGIENYGKIDPKTGIHSRILDFKKSVDFCINYSITNNIDCFIFSGDAYKNSHPTPTAQKMLLNSFSRLLDAGIPIVIIVGNHDYPGNSIKTHALDVFNYLRCENCYIISFPETLFLNTKNGPLQIVGIPWPTRNCLGKFGINLSNDVSQIISKTTSNIIKNFANKLDKNIPSILAGHMTISDGLFSGSERTSIIGKDPVFNVKDVAIEPFDYVALGHLHRNQNLNKNGYPAVVYSGSPDIIDFGEINDEKGFCEINIIEKGNVKINFIKTPIRPFFEFYFEISDKKSAEKEINEITNEYSLNLAIIKIKYKIKNNDNISESLINEFFKEAWHIADIKCVNEIKNERRSINSTLSSKNSLKDMIISYTLNNSQYNKNIEQYISEIEKYL
jgi:exonuclease SbcD